MALSTRTTPRVWCTATLSACKAPRKEHSAPIRISIVNNNNNKKGFSMCWQVSRCTECITWVVPGKRENVLFWKKIIFFFLMNHTLLSARKEQVGRDVNYNGCPAFQCGENKQNTSWKATKVVCHLRALKLVERWLSSTHVKSRPS